MHQNDTAFALRGVMVKEDALADWLFFLYKTEELTEVLKL